MKSLWQNTAELPQFPRLDGDLKTDVLIIGGGLAGILCAWELHNAGINYALVEAGRICHGTTGNTTAKITSQHGLLYHRLVRMFGIEQAARYYQIQEAALARYRSLAETVPCGFETKDAYVYSVDHLAKLEKEMDDLLRIGAAAQFVEKPHLPFPVAGAIRFPGQAQFHPLQFAAAIAKDLRIYEHTPVRSFDGTGYHTDRGTITAEKVIAATHFPLFNKHGAYFLKQYQHRSYVLALEGAADVDGMYVDEAKDGLSLRNAGTFLLLGGGGHRTGKTGGGWAALEQAAMKYFPQGKIKYCWAAQDCMTLDGMPYIGQYSPNTPNLLVATGFNKWGMTNAMAGAVLLRDLVQGKTGQEAALFSPARRMLHPQLALNAGSAAMHLLTPTVPRCPHMGCALKWNPQERSWDCPCHGSRFTREGKLLDGPAAGDLKRRKK